jgi:mono/diheme cytochrome c family protein
MTRRSFQLMWPCLLLLPAIAGSAGGWAVITVDDLPDYVVAGKPTTLTFRVRQHGHELLSGLNARVEARAGSLETQVEATPGRERGQYTATLTLPRAAEWTITIHSGFRGSELSLLPLQVIEGGTSATPALPEAERGRRLFVAKGCVTCHLHGEAKTTGQTPWAPELTGRRFPADYLRQFLANPAMRASDGGRPAQMPNLNLKQPEIAALVAFINTERQALR